MSYCGEYKQISTNYITTYTPCNNRICPICNWFKRYKQVKQIITQVTRLVTEGKKLLFGTFTIQAVKGYELSKALDILTAGIKKLLATKKVSKNLLGYMRNIEINYNKNINKFTPHMHIILVVKSTFYKGKKNYIKNNEWQRLWSSKIEHRCQPQAKVKAVQNINDDIQRVLLYNIKNNNIAGYHNINKELVQAFITLTAVIKKRRLFSFGGVLSKKFIQ